MSTVLIVLPELDHSSVAAVVSVPYPPKPKAEELVPLPPIPYLAVDKSATSTHYAPFQSSVKAEGGSLPPPKVNAAVLLTPHPA